MRGGVFQNDLDMTVARTVAVQHSIYLYCIGKCAASVSVPCPLRGWRGACLRLGPVCLCVVCVFLGGPAPPDGRGGPLTERLKTLGLGKDPKLCRTAVCKCFHADKSFFWSPNDQVSSFLPSNPSFGTAITAVTAVTSRHWLALGTPVPA